jgi:Flp pilus assembly pilin Flp
MREPNRDALARYAIRDEGFFNNKLSKRRKRFAVKTQIPFVIGILYQNGKILKSQRRNKMKMIQRFWKNEEGAELLEIAVYAGLFIVVAASALTGLGTDLKGFLDSVGDLLGREKAKVDAIDPAS